MPGPSLVQRQVDALKDLARLALERATRQTKTDADFAKEKAAAERQYQSARQGIVRRRDMQVQAIETDIGTKRQALDTAYQEGVAGAKTDRDQKIAHAKKRHQVETEAADTALEEAGWETGAVFDANIDKVNKKTEQFKARLKESLDHFDAIKEAASLYVGTYKKYIIVDPDRPPPEIAESEGPIKKLDEAVNRIIDNYESATKLKILTFVKLDFFIFLCVVAFAVLAIGLGLVLGWTLGPAIDAGRGFCRSPVAQRPGSQGDHRRRRADGPRPGRRRVPGRPLGRLGPGQRQEAPRRGRAPSRRPEQEASRTPRQADP